jgi:4-aminobutyrate aminotransferase
MIAEGPGAASEGDINITSRRARWQAENLHSMARELLARDAQAYLHQSLSTPCLNALVSVDGSWLEDLDGRRFLDFHGNSVHQVGYGHPVVIQAIKDQLDTLPFCPRRYTNEPAVRFAERLGALAPGGLSKVLMAPGGSEAISIALKLARWATGRYKTVSMWDSFHGATLDAISVGGEEIFRRGVGPLMAGSEHVPPPDPTRCPLGCGNECTMACASYLEYVLEREGDVAAVVAEPVRCTTAVIPPATYWRRIREACDRHGTLLIFDEIPTCLGRTGRMFATELTGVVPDILTIGKGLGGGVWPLAAIIAHEDLDVAQEIALGHFTHEKSPVGAAAALATLDVIQDERLVERSQVLGASYVASLREMSRRHPQVVGVRGQGLLVAMELAEVGFAEEVLYQCLSRGLSFKVSAGKVLTLTPPLTISEQDLDLSVKVLDESLAAAASTS